MNSGAGFHDVGGPVNGKLGGSVMAGAESSGGVRHDDGCRVHPKQVVTIAAGSPCSNAQGAARDIEPIPNDTPPARRALDSGIPRWLVVTGVAAVEAEMLAVIGADTNKTSPSPLPVTP